MIFEQKMSAYCMCKNATWCLGVGNSEPDRFCSNFVINVLEASDKRVWTNRKLQMFLCRLDWKHETSTVSYTTSDARHRKKKLQVLLTLAQTNAAHKTSNVWIQCFLCYITGITSDFRWSKWFLKLICPKPLIFYGSQTLWIFRPPLAPVGAKQRGVIKGVFF